MDLPASLSMLPVREVSLLHSADENLKPREVRWLAKATKSLDSDAMVSEAKGVIYLLLQVTKRPDGPGRCSLCSLSGNETGMAWEL